jgi:hypothetical protein
MSVEGQRHRFARFRMSSDMNWLAYQCEWLAGPDNWREPQATPLHFFTKAIGVLLHAVARKAVAAAQLIIGFDLPPNVLIKRHQSFVF